MMSIKEAYTKLGLVPPMERLESTLPRGRQGGSSTLMVVKAALEVLRGEHVLLRNDSNQFALALADACCAYVNKLDPSRGVFREHHRTRTLEKGGGLTYGSSNARTHSMIFNHVFVDEVFTREFIEHGNSPLARIRKLVQTPDLSFRAFDQDGNYMLDLTVEGAPEAYNLDWNRITLGRAAFTASASYPSPW